MAKPVDRRQLLASSAAAIAAPAIIPSSVFGQLRPAPSERINLAVIGLGGNGSGTLTNFLGKKEVQVVAVCDVHDQHYRDLSLIHI